MASPREYREHLYRLRTHPEEGLEDFGTDRRDSFFTVYLSMIPFAGVEYLLEKNFAGMPSGLLFPVGYLLFWAFYYTYYKPGFLEERLSESSNWNFGGVLVVLVGVAIWFVKVTVVELSQILLLRWFIGPRPRVPIQRTSDAFHRVPSRQPAVDPSGGYREFTGTWSVPPRQPQSQPPPLRRPPPRPGPSAGAPPRPGNTYVGARPMATPPPLGLPPDIRMALQILGLPEKVEWEQVHRRYRELAKKYHPDLNADRTEAGRHFMRVDAAYRRLVTVRAKYFQEKQRASG